MTPSDRLTPFNSPLGINGEGRTGPLWASRPLHNPVIPAKAGASADGTSIQRGGAAMFSGARLYGVAH